MRPEQRLRMRFISVMNVCVKRLIGRERGAHTYILAHSPYFPERFSKFVARSEIAKDASFRSENTGVKRERERTHTHTHIRTSNEAGAWSEL